MRPLDASCNANSRRPASIMIRHFGSLYTFMRGLNGALLSPFGPTSSDNASYFYAIGWSLVRYAADRYASDEAAFFRTMNQSNLTGINNLLAASGTDLDRLLAGWTLALAVDDHPLHPIPPIADLEFATWNFRDIYGGLHDTSPASYIVPYPLIPSLGSFGQFAPIQIRTLRGGGALWYEFSGDHTRAQLLRFTGPGSNQALPPGLRMAITRVE